MSGPAPIIDKTLDYKSKAFSHSSYRFTKIQPLSGSQTFNVGAASTQEALLEIPTKGWNPHECVVLWQTLMGNPGAPNYNWSAEDTIPDISQLQLYTRSGQYLADINYFSNYYQVITKKEIPFKEYETYDQLHKSYKSNTLAMQNRRYDGTGSSVNYLEHQYVNQYGIVNGNSAAVPPTSGVSYNMLKFSMIKNSIFSYNKTIMFPEVVILRIVFGPSNKGSWIGTSNVDPSTGAGQVTAGKTIQQLCMYMAVEQEQSVIDALREKMNSASGFTVPIPFVTSYKQSLTGGSQNLTLRFNRNNGITLKKIIYAPFNGAEVSNTGQDHSNVVAGGAGGKILTYYTMLNSSRIQEINISCGTDTGGNVPASGNILYNDYMYMMPQLRGSTLLNYQHYQYNWFHADHFDGALDPEAIKKAEDENLVTGLSLLDTEVKYDVVLQQINPALPNNQQLNNYLFAITQKELTIKSTMVSVV